MRPTPRMRVVVMMLGICGRGETHVQRYRAIAQRDRARCDEAERLLQGGCDPDKRFMGWTPLMKASEQNQFNLENFNREACD